MGAAPVHPSSPWSRRGRHPQRSPRCSGRASSEPGAPGTPVCPAQGMQPLARPGRVLPYGVMCVSESSPGGGGPGLEMKPGGWLQRRQGGERLAGCLPANEQPAAAGRAAGGQLPSPSLGAGSPAGLWGCPPLGQGHGMKAGGWWHLGCLLHAGFAGQNCEENIDDCPGNNCRNGGTCVDGVNTYNCQCPPEWTGSSEGGRAVLGAGGVAGERCPQSCPLSASLQGAWLTKPVGARPCQPHPRVPVPRRPVLHRGR